MRNIIVLLALLIPQVALAAGEASDPSDGLVPYNPQYQAPESESVVVEPSPEIQRLRINNEFWYILLVCLLCIVSLIIVLTFLRQQDHSAKDIVNATGLTLIIFGTIILVLVVSTSEQLTAAIGILGAIAGYLFRSVQQEGKSEKISNR